MKLSQFPIGTPAQSDFVVGVTAGNVDQRFPITSVGGRTRATSNLNFFVSATGSDSNSGTSLSPWKTIQHAWDTIAGSYDGNSFSATINVGAGTFAPLVAVNTFLGFGMVSIIGAGSGSTTIQNLAFQAAVQIPAIVVDSATLIDSNLGLGAGTCFYCQAIGGINLGTVNNDIVLDATAAAGGSYAIMYMLDGGVTVTTGSLTIKGSALRAIWVDTLSQIFVVGNITVVGTPAFSQAFIQTDFSGSYSQVGTISGAATGPRFLVTSGGTIAVGDSAGTFFPGNTAGTIRAGGEYEGVTDYIGSVAGLPAAVRGAEAFVTDGSAANVGVIASGGGGTFMPVYGDGTNWRFG